MDDEFLINILVAGKRYSIMIRRDEEEMFRKAAKWIDKKVMAYHGKYETPLEKQDILALIALQAVVEQLEMEEKNDMSPFEEKIQELDNELEKYLKDTE